MKTSKAQILLTPYAGFQKVILNRRVEPLIPVLARVAVKLLLAHFRAKIDLLAAYFRDILRALLIHHHVAYRIFEHAIFTATA